MSHSSTSTTREARWLFRSWLVLTLAAGAGMGLLGVRQAVSGNADPFITGLPIYLWIGSFVLTLALASLGRSPFAAAFGLFLGLVTYMLVDGRAEYPVSAVIAFAVHGLLPSLAAAFLVQWNGFVANGSRGTGAGR